MNPSVWFVGSTACDIDHRKIFVERQRDAIPLDCKCEADFERVRRNDFLVVLGKSLARTIERVGSEWVDIMSREKCQ